MTDSISFSSDFTEVLRGYRESLYFCSLQKIFHKHTHHHHPLTFMLLVGDQQASLSCPIYNLTTLADQLIY